VFESPIADLETGIDEDDVRHDRISLSLGGSMSSSREFGGASGATRIAESYQAATRTGERSEKTGLITGPDPMGRVSLSVPAPNCTNDRINAIRSGHETKKILVGSLEISGMVSLTRCPEDLGG
jgi:hypothetical protein